MVDGFTKDGTFRPINRSPFPSSPVSSQVLPKQTQETEKMQSDRNTKFAEGRKKASKTAKAVGGGAKAIGGFTRFGIEKVKQSRIEKSIRDREFSERLDQEIDRILDDPNTSDSSKFRQLVRFARLNRKNFTKDQVKFLDRTNRELAIRIKENQKTFSSSNTGVGSGITQEDINKLPKPVAEDVMKVVA